LIEQPASHGPGGKHIIMIISEDAAQLVGRKPRLAAALPPLTPPKQATGAVDPLLAPAETQPARHRLEAIAVDR
jgi:hypothetical protein